MGHCVKCGNSEIYYPLKRLCKKCYKSEYHKKHTGICSICNKIRPIATIRNKKIICKSCYKNKFYKFKKRKCDLCKKIGRIDRIFNKKSVCTLCNERYFYSRPKSICSVCGNLKTRCGFKSGKPICRSCRKKEQRKNGEESHKIYKYLRRTRIKDSGGSITTKELSLIRKRDKTCVYCGSSSNLSFDHIIPISRGGSSDKTNMVLACLKCNTSKNSKDVFEWCNEQKIKVPRIILKLLEGDVRDLNSD